ncbi:glycosyltransferase [Segetibacter sp. 3557_3]|uniref:glycosyltransferase family 2 protein n=1 Tax=Segetibacter sp. 3557_3 TaxID=2547429 RepID=UPI00105861D1|nr:glycosyltransferase [Segetibacter sp. 3557_3]TDH23311.1 glycosyltransferase [Segetibacter sp. 3557_3]
MTPDLAVIIPTFKRTDSLERLLDHLEAQQGVSLEVIVVDQNEPGYFAGSLLQKLQQLIWVKQPVPNASVARNNGFAHSTAPHILFVDDDLVPEPKFCAEGLNIFKTHQDIKCFVPLVYAHSGKSLALQSGKEKFTEEHSSGTGIFGITETISACIFFERSYYQQSGGFDELLFEFAKTSEDQEFFLRMRTNGLKLWLVPSIEIFHDEKVGGGCELRTAGYWNTRTKCMRAIALRHRIHKDQPGALSLSDLLQLSRSSFLNKRAITSGVGNLVSELRLLKKSIDESRTFFEANRNVYTSGKPDFLKNHSKKKQQVTNY